MKFEKSRLLRNNVFSSTINRVEDDNQDCILEEKTLENDFGPVQIDMGGKFEAVIEKDEDKLKITPIVSSNAESIGAKANFKFSLPMNKVSLLMGTSLNFSCDSCQEVSRVFDELKLSPQKAAEFKCLMFEEIILDKIKVAIEKWKSNKTNFESEILDPVHFSLV